MPREAHPQRSEALALIREHVARLGRLEGQRAARRLFPEVATPTWQGWCRLERMGNAPDDDLDVAHPLAFGSPNVPSGGQRTLRFEDRIAHMDAISGAMLDSAWPMDGETGRRGRLRNPMLAKYAHAAMTTTAGLVVRHSEGMWHAERVGRMHSELVQAISDVADAHEDKALAREMLIALHALMKRWRDEGSYQAGA